ncbi:MAG TPA: hypothetical protein VJ124_21770 [Pyrinomonadaceae bacterium]|nr:hypothetical protein [Pyrinomonadaceae bacterium]
MKLRELLVITIMTGLALSTAKAFYPATDNSAPGNLDDRSPTLSLPAAPSSLVARDKVLRSAYYDTLTILSASNSCSDFFGGSDTAVDVFNRLMALVKKDYYVAGVGMRMSGSIATVLNAQTKVQYRLFDNLSINLNGPFYRRRVGNVALSVNGVGTFAADSKEVRVLMFMHELGHLIKGPEGEWLLPDDGSDQDLSRENSLKIERVCGEQIRALGKTFNLAVTGKKKSEQAMAQDPAISRHSDSKEKI